MRYIFQREILLSKKPTLKCTRMERLETRKELLHNGYLLTKIFYRIFFIIHITIFSCDDHTQKYHTQRTFHGDMSSNIEVQYGEEYKGCDEYEEDLRQGKKDLRIRIQSQSHYPFRIKNRNIAWLATRSINPSAI